MLTVLALIIIAVLLFELIILFHEGGHFVSAKLSGVQVNEFALGMGPKLFGFKKGETQYSFRLFPIGGYCAMEAEDEESDSPRAFTNAKIWKRMIIIVAGAFMNIVLGLILMFVIVIQSPSYSSTTINSFPQNSYSANCGLQVGDKILEIDGYNVYCANDISYAVATIKYDDYEGDSLNIYKQDCASTLTNAFVNIYYAEDADYTEQQLIDAEELLASGVSKINVASSNDEANSHFVSTYNAIYEFAGITIGEIPKITIKDSRTRYRTDVVVEREGEKITLENVDFFTYLESEDAESPSVSVDFYVDAIDKNILTVLSQTGAQTVSVVRMIWDSLVGLLTGQFSINDVSGPVGAASAITQVASQGLERSFLDAVNNIIYIMMIISVNLGIFNMLPFPALDGGRFLFLLIEAIFKKPIPRKVESIVNGVGLLVLLIFMVLITFKDVWQLVT